jgi:HlyD family secretion protein
VLVALAVIVGATVYAFWPAPTTVDVATVDRGPMTVTIDEEGIANIRDVFRVSAPTSGALERLPVHVGDRVTLEAPVAQIRPAQPAFLDARTRQQLEAGVEAAVAAVGLAQAQLDAAVSGQGMAEDDYNRAAALAKGGTISTRDLQQATTSFDTAKANVAQARANLALRQSELTSARAELIEPDQTAPAGIDLMCCLDVPAPVDGVVLKVLAQSAQVVAPGAPLLEIGDPTDLEIVVHLLSSDAVAVVPNAPATITEWGGPPLNAKVRQVEPAAYTKVSALGIEEQRVDAELDLTDPPSVWAGLGHSFSVMVHIQTWSSAEVVRVPLAALFRQGADWAVFRMVNGKAVATRVSIGHRTDTAAEVVAGLAPGAVVVLHPSDQVSDGAAVAERPNGYCLRRLPWCPSGVRR